MPNLLHASSSPHERDTVTTREIMLDVIIALTPTLIYAVWYFGSRTLLPIISCVLLCPAFEWLYQKHAKQKVTTGDLSAVVTGVILAANLPADAPLWICVAACFIAIILIKQMFGGIGSNFMNPAMASRTILMISWASAMSTVVVGRGVDTLTSATPLALAYSSSPSPYTIADLFIGNIPGMLGEVNKLLLLIGGIYLIWRRVVTWHIPLTFIGTVFILFWIQTGSLYTPSSSQCAIYQTLSGGLFLGAFFMATDYVTSPITNIGKIIMGIGCGAIMFVIRAYNPSYPEGCSFAILFMNLLTPLINRAIRPRVFSGKTEAKASV